MEGFPSVPGLVVEGSDDTLLMLQWVVGVKKEVLVYVGGFSIYPVKREVTSYETKISSISFKFFNFVSKVLRVLDVVSGFSYQRS